MSAATVSDLLASGFVLWALVPVQCSDHAALPVAWQSLQNYSATTNLAWSLATPGYTSFTPLQQGKQIAVGFYTPAPMQLGQVLGVAAGGIGTVGSNGIPGAIAFVNRVVTQFTCGLTLPVSGNPIPICAAPLYGNNIQCIAPMGRIFLMFSTQPITTGEIIVTSSGPGMLADFVAANTQSLTVNYDIDSGWSWGNFAWGSQCPPLSNLHELLIQQPGSTLRVAERRWRQSYIAHLGRTR